jgi:VanZ family protein
MQQPTKSLLRHKYKILAVSYTFWLTTISLIPMGGINLPSFSYADKLVHFLLYFFLTVFWLLAYPKLWDKRLRFILLVIAWGILIEIIQGLVPERSPELWDAVANTIGGVTGLIFYHNVLHQGSHLL